MATWLTVLIVALAATTWVAAMVAVGVALRRVLAASPPAIPKGSGTAVIPDSPQPDNADSPAELRHLGDDRMYAPDYADVETLISLAHELGINVDATHIEQGIAIADSVDVEASVESQLAIPQVASVGSSLQASVAHDELRTHVVSTTRRSTAAELLYAVCQKLDSVGRLRFDLLDIRPGSESDWAIAYAMGTAYRDWKEAIDAGTPPKPPPDAEASEAADPPAITVKAAVDKVWAEAISRIQRAKLEELKEVARDAPNNFALLRGMWISWKINDRRELWSHRVYMPPASDDGSWILCANLVKVIMDDERLTRFGDERFAHNIRVPAVVFGKIGSFDDKSNVLKVVPILIYAP